MADGTVVATPEMQSVVQSMYEMLGNLTEVAKCIEHETLKLTDQRNELITQYEHLKLSPDFQFKEKESLMVLGIVPFSIRHLTDDLTPKLDSVLIGWFENLDVTEKTNPLYRVWRHTLQLIAKALVRRGDLRVAPSIAELDWVRLEAQNIDVWKTAAFKALKAEGLSGVRDEPQQGQD